MLEELRSIRMIQHPKRARMITEIIGRQVDVFKEFKMPVPVKLVPKDRGRSMPRLLPKTVSTTQSCKTNKANLHTKGLVRVFEYHLVDRLDFVIVFLRPMQCMQYISVDCRRIKFFNSE